MAGSRFPRRRRGDGGGDGDSTETDDCPVSKCPRSNRERRADAAAMTPLRVRASRASEALFPGPPLVGPEPNLRSDLRGLSDDWHKVPDTVLDGADVGDLAIRGASVRGDAHRYESNTRQDAMDISRVRDGEIDVMLGCVADGVSREPLSQVGAAQACLLVRDEVRQRLSVLLAVDSAPDVKQSARTSRRPWPTGSPCAPASSR